MKLRRLTKTLIRHEGMRGKPYDCPAGFLTIGVGRNLEANGISEEEALVLLRNDIVSCYQQCKREFSWFEDLNDVRQEAIINLVFNIGLDGFKKFKKTIGFIKQEKWSEAATELLDSRYADQVGKRAQEVSRMLETGVL